MATGVENVEQKCLECGQRCTNRRSLGNHLMRSHPQLGGQRAYVLKHFLGGVVPKCGCGCEQDVQWHKLLYKFNDYVTGHNRSNLVGYKHTPEQLDRRNDAIRQSYVNNAEEIGAKIGLAVHEAFKDPTKNARLRDGQRRGWAHDTERKQKLSERNVEMLAKGIIGPQAPFKVEWKLNPFTGKDELMHSSWESAFLDRAATLGVPVTKDHGLVVPYVGPDGEWHRYVPDFVAPHSCTVFEVKGHHDEWSRAKQHAAEAWCSANNMRYVMVSDASSDALDAALQPPTDSASRP